VPSPYLAILILNYNGGEDTIACVQSILKDWRDEYELIVIDNASTDDSVAKLRRWAEDQRPPLELVFATGQKTAVPPETGQSNSPRLTLLQTGSNLGFAGGNNVGIRYALARGASWILLLNNDTVIEAGALAKLIEGAERSGADLAGGGIYEYDRPSRPWYLGGTFNWWGDRTVRSLRLPSATAIAVQTDWITGCCLLVRGRVFEEIGLLDEGAFLYYEDSDFCRRAAKAGFKRFVVPDARVYHKVSRSSTPHSAFQRYHATRSRVYFHSKNHTAGSHALFLIMFILSRMGRSLIWFFGGRWDLISASWRALEDSFRQAIRPQPAPSSPGIEEGRQRCD